MNELKVLYEDNHVIAVFKPAGISVQGNESKTESLMDLVKEHLKEKYKKPGNVFLGLVHRLDRQVSGIVVFAKNSKSAARLSEQFREREIKKTYHAVVEGKLDLKKGAMTHYMKKDEQIRKAIISESPLPGYDEAELEYEVIRSNGSFSLLKINLKTGRFHQIRAQLSIIGHPVAGDIKYGGKKYGDDGSICLCATEIEFQKTISDETIHLKIDFPKEWDRLLL